MSTQAIANGQANHPTTPQVTQSQASQSTEAILAEITRLRAENAALTAARAKPQGLTLKVSGKGALSVYGLGRFPVTLYGEQWARLLAEADRLKAFIEAHKAELSTKADAKGKGEGQKGEAF